METSQNQQERERLQQEIQQIRQALQSTANEEDSSDEEDNDNLILDEDSKHEQDDEEEAGPSGYNDSRPHSRSVSDVNMDNNSFQLVQDSKSNSVFSAQDLEVNLDKLQLDEEGNLPTSLEAALAINRAYQEIVTDNIKQLEVALVQNREKQKLIEEEIEGKVENTKKGPKAFKRTDYAIPFFKSFDGEPAPVNEDVKTKKAGGFIDHHLVKPVKSWTAEDKKKLYNAVMEDSLRRLMQPLLNKKEIEIEKLNSAISADEENKIKYRIKDIEKEISDIKESEERQKILKSLDESSSVDWMKIANIHFEGERTAGDCQAAWSNVLHPDINKSKWTVAEEAKLKTIVEQFEQRNWTQIAEALGTGRSAFMCLQRYQQKLNPTMYIGQFTPEEDELLKEVVSYSRIGNTIRWVQVVYFMEGRSIYQCCKRWEKIQTDLKWGKWTREEDFALKTAVDRCGPRDFHKIAKLVKGRTGAQCRERWQNVLSSSLNFAPWTYEQDRKLLELSGKYGKGKWAKIAAEIPGKNDRMVKARHQVLMKWKEKEELMKERGFEGWALPKDLLKKRKEQLKNELLEIQKKYESDLEKLKEMMEAQSDPNEAHTMQRKVTLKSKKDQKLQSLYAKVLHEQQEDEKQITLQLKDMESGLYIPRPMTKDPFRRAKLERWDFLMDAMDDYLQKKMKNLLKTKVEPAKCDKALSTSSASAVARFQRIKNLKILTPELRLRIHMLTPLSTVREILKVSREIKQQLENAKKTGRRRVSVEGRKLDQALICAFRSRVTRQKRGRPRKYYSMGAKTDRQHTEEQTSLILPLLFKTEAVDVAGAEHNLKAIRQRQEGETSKSPIKTAETASNIDEVLGQRRSRRKEKAQSKQEIRQTPPVSNLKALTLEQDMDTLESVLEFEPQLNKYLETIRSPLRPEGGSTSQEGETTGTPSQALEGRQHQQAVSRRVREDDTGEAEGNESSETPAGKEPKKLDIQQTPSRPYEDYNLPPFPPTCSTLNGFKGLLLERRHLLSVGGSYHNKTGMVKIKANEEIGAKGKGKGKKSKHKTDLEAKKFEPNSEKMNFEVYSENPLIEIRKTHDYKLLKARFSSLFLWPAMLSTIHTPESLPVGQSKPDEQQPDSTSVKSSTDKTETPAATKKPKKRKVFPCTAGPRKRQLQVKRKEEKKRIEQAHQAALEKRSRTQSHLKQFLINRINSASTLDTPNNSEDGSADVMQDMQDHSSQSKAAEQSNQSSAQEQSSQSKTPEQPSQSSLPEKSNNLQMVEQSSQSILSEQIDEMVPDLNSHQNYKHQSVPAENGATVLESSPESSTVTTNGNSQKPGPKMRGRKRGKGNKRVWFKPGEANTRKCSSRASKDAAKELLKKQDFVYEYSNKLPKKISRKSSSEKIEVFVEAVKRMREEEEEEKEQSTAETLSSLQQETTSSATLANGSGGQGHIAGSQGHGEGGQVVLIPSANILTPVVLAPGEALFLGNPSGDTSLREQTDKITGDKEA